MDDIEAGQEDFREEGAREGGGSEGSKVRPERRHWSDEEKAWMVQESFERGRTVEAVAERHGVPMRQLSYWRKRARRGELAVPALAPAEGGFAAVELETAATPAHVGSVSIEARGVTVRLDGDVSTVRITAIASALRAIR